MNDIPDGPPTYGPSTAADAFDELLRGSDPRIVIGDFIDDRRRTAAAGRPALIRAPIAMTSDPETSRWAAFFAAMVDQLAHEAGMRRPRWVSDPLYVLERPWFLVPGWPLRAWQLTQTPIPFRLRNIFGGDDLLRRV